MSAPIAITVTAPNLDRLNSELGLYAQLARKTMSEVVAKKGRDLGIQLQRQFTDHRFGGKGGGKIARTELENRTSRGIGTRVRPSVLQELGVAAKSESQRGNQRTGNRRRLSLWQIAVGREVSKRQAGRGVLGASFLLFRKRTSQSRGTFLVVNRTGNPMGKVEQGDGFLSIVGYTPGLQVVNMRYGVVNNAAAMVRRDMQPYFKRKLGENSAAFQFIKAA